MSTEDYTERNMGNHLWVIEFSESIAPENALIRFRRAHPQLAITESEQENDSRKLKVSTKPIHVPRIRQRHRSRVGGF